MKSCFVKTCVLLAILFFTGACIVQKRVSELGAKAESDKKKYSPFRPGELWYDTDGNVINAHGSGLLFRNNTYYWCGEVSGATASQGVNVCSSKDLYDWRFEALALAQEKDTASDIRLGCVMERPKVIYNEKTKKYVVWFHLELKGKGYSAARAGVAMSVRPTGPFMFVKSFRPNDNMSRDMTLFVDYDGSAYQVYSSRKNYDLRLAKLSDDYLSATVNGSLLFSKHREAPALFRYRDNYFLITSGCTGWAPNRANLHEAKSLFGPWEFVGDPMTGPGAELTFGGQLTYVLPVLGKKDALPFMADRWNPKKLKDSRYRWLPVQFKEGMPFIGWTEEWHGHSFR